jgi:hypothetical protein
MYNYATLARLTGMNYDAVCQHRSRGNFDPNDLASVLVWLGRHAKKDLRQRLLHAALDRIYGGPKPKRNR